MHVKPWALAKQFAVSQNINLYMTCKFYCVYIHKRTGDMHLSKACDCMYVEPVCKTLIHDFQSGQRIVGKWKRDTEYPLLDTKFLWKVMPMFSNGLLHLPNSGCSTNHPALQLKCMDCVSCDLYPIKLLKKSK